MKLMPSIIKKWPKTTMVLALIAAVSIFGILKLVQPTPPEYITEPVIRGNLQQTVEAIGTVISERDLKLQFPLTGIIDEVNVEEGQTVKAGQQLARLRSSGLASDITSARASIAAAEADVENLEAGTRPEELEIAKAAVVNKQASLAAAQRALELAISTVKQSESRLQVLKSETSTTENTSVNTVASTISRQLTTLLTAIQVLDGIKNDKVIQDVFIKNDPARFNAIERSISEVEADIQLLQSKYRVISEYVEAIKAFEASRQLAEETAEFVSRVYLDVSALPETQFFTASTRETVKSTIATQLTSVQAVPTSLDTALQTLKNLPASNSTRIANEETALLNAKNAQSRAETDVETAKTLLSIEEANLRLKQAGSRPGDIAAAKARLSQAYATLQRAQERYNDTIIRAPIDGVITTVNLKVGELLSTAFASESAITMLGTAPYRIEMYVPEIDVPKVRLGMSGSIVLDAFSEKSFSLTVSELEPTSTIVDGIAKYKAILDFTETPDVNEIKIGMTGDTEIFTNFAEGVLQIPARAVRRNAEGFEVVDVLTAEQTIEPVSIATGLEGEGGYLEVVAGLEEGQIIVVLQK